MNIKSGQSLLTKELKVREQSGLDTIHNRPQKKLSLNDDIYENSDNKKVNMYKPKTNWEKLKEFFEYITGM